MCGVGAIVAPRWAPDVLARRAAEFASLLHHRAPDHAASTVDGPVALAHTRLRIVDPRPEADQPMERRGLRLVFSGAILNHKDLRSELETDHGVAFATTSDTEVLLEALRVFGDGALERLEGMFAFVLHDVARRRVLAARDRAGIKPLVWGRGPDRALLFASEARALVAAGVDRSIDRLAFRQLLRFNHPLGDRTFFAGVRSIEPGCMMTLDLDAPEPRIRRYYGFRLRPSAMSFDAAVETLDQSFTAAIARAVDVDVPYGAYLSGGVDSSGIAAELARTRATPRLYSLVLPGIRYSEERHIDRATKAFGATARKVAIRKLSLTDIVDYARRAEMPQWWTSDLALGELARRARGDGTRVVLSGEGPDELFAGYEVYRIGRIRARLGRAGNAIGRAAWALPLVQRFVPWLDMDMSVANAYLATHEPTRRESVLDHFGFYPENLALWEVLEARAPLASDGAAEAEAYRDYERAYFREQLAPACAGLSALEQNLHFEIAERLPRWILHMGDRMSAAHGIEVRFPYLDDRFFDLASRLPLDHRATVFRDKRALRAMHRRRLPRALAHRRKQPLYTPTAEWLGDVLHDPAFEQYWSRAAFDRVGLLDFAACDTARQRLQAKRAPDALTAMVDDWLFTFALTTQIVAQDLGGA